jgi:hypothetical protein
MPGMDMPMSTPAATVAAGGPVDPGAVTDPQADPASQAFYNKVVAGTARFQDINVALKEGYGQDLHQKDRNVLEDASQPGDIIHLDGYTVADHMELNPNQPESLMYQLQANGSFKLVGVMFAAETHDEWNTGIPLMHLHRDENDGFPGGVTNEMGHVWFTPTNLAGAFGDHDIPAEIGGRKVRW